MRLATNENGPILTVHFEGADVELKSHTNFNRPVKEYEYYCFAITNLQILSWILRMAQDYMAAVFKQIF